MFISINFIHFISAITEYIWQQQSVVFDIPAKTIEMDFQHILDNIFHDLNQVRLHPRGVSQRIGQLKSAYNGRLFDNKIKTREGARALDDLINDLNSRHDINQRLKWSFALHLAADEQASILGEQGLITTEGTRMHRSLPDRIQQYAIVRGRISQIYQFGGRKAEQILQELLIDDGLSSRKRRNTLLDPIYKYIGIGCSYHEKLQACTVIILAQDIVSLVAPGSAGKFKRRKGIEQGKQFVFNLEQQILLNPPGMNNLNQNNQGLQNALLGDLNNYENNMQQNLRNPVLNDLNNYENNMQQNLRNPVLNDMNSYQNNNMRQTQTNQDPSFILDNQNTSQNRGNSTYYPPQGRTTVDEYDPSRSNNTGNMNRNTNIQNTSQSQQRQQTITESNKNYQPQKKDVELDNIRVSETQHAQEKKKCSIM